LQFEVNPSSKPGLPCTCELRRRDVVRVPDNDGFWLVTPHSNHHGLRSRFPHSIPRRPRGPGTNLWRDPPESNQK
jgi:hypothetical protein